MNLHIIEKENGNKTLLPACVKTSDKIIAGIKMEMEEIMSFMESDDRQELINNFLEEWKK